MLQLLTVWN